MLRHGDAAAWAAAVSNVALLEQQWAAWEAGFAAAMADTAAAVGWQDGWQDVGHYDEAGAESVQMILRQTKQQLLTCPAAADCCRQANLMAETANLLSAVQLYIHMTEEPAVACQRLLPRARDVVAAHAAVAAGGISDKKAFTACCEAAFQHFGTPWSMNLSSQFQGSWRKVTEDVQGAWRSKKAGTRHRREASAAARAAARAAAAAELAADPAALVLRELLRPPAAAAASSAEVQTVDPVEPADDTAASSDLDAEQQQHERLT